jgi:GTP-binding protein
MKSFAFEMASEGEDEDLEYIDDVDVEDVEDFEEIDDDLL